MWVRKPAAKKLPLGPAYDGPWEVVERRGTACVLLRVGTLVDGTPRTELHHLENCKPAFFADPDQPYVNERPKLGRPAKQPGLDAPRPAASLTVPFADSGYDGHPPSLPAL